MEHPGGRADQELVRAWAASGAMALTGASAANPGPPARLISGLRQAASRIRAGLGIDVDPLALLGERAAIAGLAPGGQVSCGGATQLVEAVDGWLAVTLARPDDLDLVPAWLGLAGPTDDPWAALATAAAVRSAEELVKHGIDLGLPVALLPDRSSPAAPPLWPVTHAPIVGSSRSGPAPSDLVVVDLTSLWAGPLVGSLLVAAGATVIKVESTHRPDGARRGPGAFFDLLNAGKRSVALDLQAPDGRAQLRDLLVRADAVLEASRPRALEQLGIHAEEILAAGGPRVWVSITGHGRTGPARNRVAFGDDAAVAGGLVCWQEGRPVFCADAVADPATGVVATAALADALAAGGAQLLDVSMAQVAAFLAGPTVPVEGPVEIAPPRARVAGGRAPRLGDHTAAVLADAVA